MEVFAGFIIGLLGSFHCIGMCGPIVLALPVEYKSNVDLFFGRLFYNLGRVVTYTLLGIIVGLFGQKIFVIGAQQYVSVIFGIILLLSVLLPSQIKHRFTSIGFVNYLTNIVKRAFSQLIRSGNKSNLFLFGIVNGLLPCGFVYVGLGSALSLGNVTLSTLFMLFFGLGTVPIMFATSVFGGFINNNLRTKINKLLPVFAIILALIFILRGLNLGIPMLSPKMNRFF
ncbi:MAG: sulfite exporter TauE/SafE family protein [Ignavibacteriales bacterium]